MQINRTMRAGVATLVLLALVGCDEGMSFNDKSFRTHYIAARDALEAGKYASASRSYARLLPQAGPFEPRVRLEYAHALLRGGKYEDAAREAGQLAMRQSDTARRAALAVRATAQHELGLQALMIGDTALGKRLLQEADGAITEVLEHDPTLDPLGALAGRQASIKVRLKAL
ncbi:MAG: hypothetical protein QNJ09_01890 [Paracoccaceae bacterium]|nr:hypothetical protein [Paracoccaceae bacterium]